MQDENNPDFVVEVVTLFFQDTERLLTELAQILCEACPSSLKNNLLLLILLLCFPSILYWKFLSLLMWLSSCCILHRDQQIIDFNRLDAYVHQLKGSSSRCLWLHFYFFHFYRYWFPMKLISNIHIIYQRAATLF